MFEEFAKVVADYTKYSEEAGFEAVSFVKYVKGEF